MPDFVPRLSPEMLQILQRQVNPTSPGGIAGLLQTPGLSQGLMAAGSALLQQKDTPGSFGAALGRAIPVGVAGFQRGQQAHEFEQLLANADPQTQALMKILGPERGAALLAQQMQPKRVTLGEGDQLVDSISGEVVSENAPQAEFEYRQDGSTIAVLQDGALVDQFDLGSEDVDFNDVDKLRTQFSSQIQPFDEAMEAFRKVETAGLKENPTAADDIAIVFQFMKTVDPGSTVREGEFATAQNAAGVPQRVQNLYNQVLEGTRLSPDQRRDFVQTAREAVESQVPVFERRAEFYRNIAERNGFDPADVIRNPFADLAPPDLADPLGIR